ncbi:uncharacterized protein LOC113278884 [Papaver somniferum]|uniref:uncharacterized protein LOC113278884 n=1 Tax=Papaver somniferum TaxID=3469 RepID=UPI000E704813|nr:uncharacterized protein LOC113278884 [Papaver somniferum]
MVEVEVSKTLPFGSDYLVDGVKTWIKFSYALPPFKICQFCRSLDHSKNSCTPKRRDILASKSALSTSQLVNPAFNSSGFNLNGKKPSTSKPPTNPFAALSHMEEDVVTNYEKHVRTKKPNFHQPADKSKTKEVMIQAQTEIPITDPIYPPGFGPFPKYPQIISTQNPILESQKKKWKRSKSRNSSENRILQASSTPSDKQKREDDHLPKISQKKQKQASTPALIQIDETNPNPNFPKDLSLTFQEGSTDKTLILNKRSKSIKSQKAVKDAKGKRLVRDAGTKVVEDAASLPANHLEIGASQLPQARLLVEEQEESEAMEKKKVTAQQLKTL